MHDPMLKESQPKGWLLSFLDYNNLSIYFLNALYINKRTDMIQSMSEEDRVSGSLEMKKTVMKGSAGKMVNREELPPAPVPAPALPTKPSLTIELIRKAKILADSGQSQSAIGKALDKEESWVRGSLLIATKLPEKAHQAIADSKLSRTAALQLLLANPAKMDAILDGVLILAETEGKL